MTSDVPGDPCLVVHLKRSPYDVRIDRSTKWGNPFRIGPGSSREDVIQRYEQWLQHQSDLLADLHELRGKTLGCWCAPKPCHGDVLVRYVDQSPQEK